MIKKLFFGLFALLFFAAPAHAMQYIKSVQPFTITIAASTASNTYTLPKSVTTANAVIFYNGITSAELSGSYMNWETREELTSTNTVTCNRNNSTTSAVICAGTVVEFQSAALEGFDSQCGTITIPSASASNTATINTVTTANSAVFFLGFTGSGASTAAGNFFSTLALTNATTVTATRGTAATGFTATVGYCVVDFNSAILKSIQPKSVTLSSANTSDTQAISSVTPGNTILLYNGLTSTNNTLSNLYYNFQLSNATTVTLTRTGTATTARTINFTALEFASGILNSSVQRGAVALASVTSNTASLSPGISTSLGFVNWIGFSTTATSNPETLADIVLTNATTVTAAKNTAGVTTSTVSWEALEFPAPTIAGDAIWFGMPF